MLFIAVIYVLNVIFERAEEAFIPLRQCGVCHGLLLFIDNVVLLIQPVMG
jgi:hypothetical protein